MCLHLACQGGDSPLFPPVSYATFCYHVHVGEHYASASSVPVKALIVLLYLAFGPSSLAKKASTFFVSLSRIVSGLAFIRRVHTQSPLDSFFVDDRCTKTQTLTTLARKTTLQ